MKRWYMVIAVSLWMTQSIALAQRTWILPVDELRGSGWVEETTGGYDDGVSGSPFDGRYWWAVGKDGVRRAYWRFDAEDIPAQPALYTIETWVPSNHAFSYSVIEGTVTTGPDDDHWPNEIEIPWLGLYGSNHQWINRNQGNQGGWVQCGPGPQTPDSDACNAGGDSANSMYMWLRRGSRLYVKFDFDFYGTFGEVGVSAVRITEVFPPTPTCDPAVFGGPVDLRCVGNADPLYGSAEVFAQADETSISEWEALAADGYLKGKCFSLNDTDYYTCPPFCPVSPGLPQDGDYTAHLPDGDVDFQLHYDGLNTIKWDSSKFAGALNGSNVYALNDVAGREFVEGTYSTLFFLTAFSGSGGQLRVDAVYEDASVDTAYVNVYDWFNNSGDSASIAVGLDGNTRDSGGIGFQRLKADGSPDPGDGTTSGAFLFVHKIEVNPVKVLAKVELSMDPSFSGRLNLLAATFEDAGAVCNDPTFDVDGDGDVDQSDFAFFQACYTGAGDLAGLYDPDQCQCLNVDGDSDVDGDDYAMFEACASGPEIAVADPSCDGL